jgi:uncharacterized protein (DUF1501 family)
LFGGNDSNNVLIPFDASGYATYSNVRGPLALAQNTLLPLTRESGFALHPSLPDIQTLFDNGNAAFLANVGTLVQPLTQAQYQAGQLPIPDYLFSHQDQQLEWQNSEISSATPTGWAGRVSDLLSAKYNPDAKIPLVTSVAGDTLFCNGVATSPVAVVPESVSTGQCSEGRACNIRQIAEQKIINFASGFHLVQEDTITTRQADTYITRIADALSAVEPLQTHFPPNALGFQLEQIAQLIKIRAAMGVTRQIFFAGLGNFDTHSNQLVLQQKLLSVISPAMGAFYQATQELGIANQVTSFTMSDFARAFQPNSNGGTDHGWGGHQIVFGGAVKGGKIYGDFPTQVLAGPDDVANNGRWIPTTSSVQFAATLASWFGVPNADLPSVFPLLGNFMNRNLGFLS